MCGFVMPNPWNMIGGSDSTTINLLGKLAETHLVASLFRLTKDFIFRGVMARKPHETERQTMRSARNETFSHVSC